MLKSSPKAQAAYDFIEYVAHGDGVKTHVETGAFPADKASLEADYFKNATTIKNSDGKEIDYFGGQKYNEAHRTGLGGRPYGVSVPAIRGEGPWCLR